MGDDEPDYGEPEYREPGYDSPEYEPPDPDWEQGPDGTFIHWPRDPQLDPAKTDLMTWFGRYPNAVFYGRQIEVIFEKTYFHWITHKALRELTREEVIASDLRMTPGGNRIRLYWSKRNRYPRRAAAMIVKQH